MKHPKARTAAECLALEQLAQHRPIDGRRPARAGHRHPRDLATRDAYALYQALCRPAARARTRAFSTPSWPPPTSCAARPAPWWAYTAERKRLYGAI
jgi:hypothetical protein